MLTLEKSDTAGQRASIIFYPQSYTFQHQEIIKTVSTEVSLIHSHFCIFQIILQMSFPGTL